MADQDIRMQEARARVEARRAAQSQFNPVMSIARVKVRECRHCGNSISHKHTNAIYCDYDCWFKNTQQYRNERERERARIKRQDLEFRKKRAEYQRSVLDRSREYHREWRKRNKDRLREQIFRARVRREYKNDLSMLPPKPAACENPFCTGTKVVFEHNHSTGKFRGWVCQRCNCIVGYAGDNPSFLRWLADYLDERG